MVTLGRIVYATSFDSVAANWLQFRHAPVSGQIVRNLQKNKPFVSLQMQLTYLEAIRQGIWEEKNAGTV